MTRALIKLGNLELDLEGEEEFVKAQIDRFQDIVSRQERASKAQPMRGTGELLPEPESMQAPARTKRSVKRGGPSCASRILGLQDDGFFSDPRSSSEVEKALRDAAYPYPAKHVAASMGDLVKRKKLRRFDREGTYVYVNP